MSSRGSSAQIRNTPVVAVSEKTLQAMFDTLKENHCALKGELKCLINRTRAKGEIGNLKAMILEFPPLHALNEMLEEILESPIQATRGPVGLRISVNPQATTKLKKCSPDGSAVAASKALRFSPVLLKKEACTTKESAPVGAVDHTADDSDEKVGDDDDDVVEYRLSELSRSPKISSPDLII